MSREWQQTRMRKFVMPDAVYHQCLWAVRDLCRMEQRLDELKAEELAGSSVVREDFVDIIAEEEDRRPMEREILEGRVGKIYGALEIVPVTYRVYILRNIVHRESGKTYPAEWRMWKQRFLFQVARNFNMM